jgi:hypothetical protein
VIGVDLLNGESTGLAELFILHLHKHLDQLQPFDRLSHPNLTAAFLFVVNGYRLIYTTLSFS